MKAIEIRSKTDKSGRLKLDYKLEKPEANVRVLILFDDEKNEHDDEKLWLQYISKDPAFSFLNEPEEDIYSLKDGEEMSD